MILQRIKKRLQKKAVVLMYHRIATPATDPWLLCVSEAHFEQQLQVLRKHYKVIGVEELIEQHARRAVRSKSICITFDDGYRDNYLAAKPLLEKWGCPASFFLPTHFIGSTKLFWWDELEQIMLRQQQLPPLFNLTLQNQPFVFELTNETVLTPGLWSKHQTWSAYDPPPTRRCELYYKVWEQLRPLPLADIAARMDQIKDWASAIPSTGETDLPFTTQHMQEMQAQPLFTIGLHTVTHPDLASHTVETQRRELVESIHYFKNHLGQQVRTLAYPYGRYNEATLALARELDVQAAFTTFAEPVTNGADRHQFGRFQVQNLNGKDFKLQLRRWSKTWLDW